MTERGQHNHNKESKLPSPESIDQVTDSLTQAALNVDNPDTKRGLQYFAEELASASVAIRDGYFTTNSLGVVRLPFDSQALEIAKQELGVGEVIHENPSEQVVVRPDINTITYNETKLPGIILRTTSFKDPDKPDQNVLVTQEFVSK